MSRSYRTRFGLRSKLLLLSSFLLVLPWLGYQYILEMESYLARGQQQVVLGTARALASALSERPELFNARSWSRARDSQGLYVYPVFHPLRVDDRVLLDWRDYQQYEQVIEEGSDTPYSENRHTSLRKGGDGDPLRIHLMLGEASQYLYLYVRVEDRHLVLREPGDPNLDRSDALHLAMVDPWGGFEYYIVAPAAGEGVKATRTGRDKRDISAYMPEPRISGQMWQVEGGYVYELRMPMDMVGDQFGLAVYDVDDAGSRRLEAIVASSGLHEPETLGSLQRPVPEIDRIVAGMGHTNSLVRVIDSTQRVLLSNGSIATATGLMLVDSEPGVSGPWSWLRDNFLHNLYEYFLTQPTEEYVDELYEGGTVEGELAIAALTGVPRVDFQMLPAAGEGEGIRVLQAAWPISVGEQILGAVVVDQNMDGITTFRNQALQLLFDIMLGIILVTVLALFLFASKLSSRLLALRNQAERIIDDKGRFTNTIVPSRTPDEIGDLSRSFANIVDRLGQYTHYLENMSSRLSHELRTPVTVVRSSLENLSLVTEDAEAKVYIQRAEEGISRLNLILNKMSEATRLEQILQDSEKEPMELERVVAACVAEYRQIYPHLNFEARISTQPVPVLGTAEYIAQMMDKIVANAVDFADPAHPVRIHCGEDAGEAVISVANHGPLLDLHMKDRIFDSMVSVRPESRKKLPHLGMGLHIARMITEYHGGYIYADNLMSGDGVIVVIRLPLHRH